MNYVVIAVSIIYSYGFRRLEEWNTCRHFIISRSREQDLYPVLQALHRRLQSIADDWNPSAIIVDNAQAEINTFRLVGPQLQIEKLLHMLLKCIYLFYIFHRHCHPS